MKIQNTKKINKMATIIIGLFIVVFVFSTIFKLTHRVEEKKETLIPTKSQAHTASTIINACDSGTYQDTYITCAELEADPGKPHCLNKSYLAGCYKMEGDELVLHWELKFNDLEAPKLQSGERALENYFSQFQTIPEEDGTTLPYRGWPRETTFGIVTDFNGDGVIQCKDFNDPAEPQYEMISSLFSQGSFLNSCQSVITRTNCTAGTPHCHGPLRDCRFTTHWEDGNKLVTCWPEGLNDYVYEFRINLNDYTNGVKPIYLFYEQKIPNGLLCDTVVKDGCIDAGTGDQKGEEYVATLVFYPPGVPQGETKLITESAPTPDPNVCNPGTVDMTVGTVYTGSDITFAISGDEYGNVNTTDSWSGGISCSQGMDAVPLGAISESMWMGTKTCSAVQAGNYTWTHTWENTEGGTQCSKTVSFNIIDPPTNTPIPGTPTPWLEVFSNTNQVFEIVELKQNNHPFPPYISYSVITGDHSMGYGTASELMLTDPDYEYTGFRVEKNNYTVAYDTTDDWNFISTSDYYNFVGLKSSWLTGKRRIDLTFTTNTPSPTYIITDTPIPTNTPTNNPTNTPIPPTHTPLPSITPIDVSNTPTNVPTTTPSNTVTSTPTNTHTPVPSITPWPTGCSQFDLFADDKIDISDFVLFMQDYNTQDICNSLESRSDFHQDCEIDISDFVLFAKAHKIFNYGLPDHPVGTCWQGD